MSDGNQAVSGIFFIRGMAMAFTFALALLGAYLTYVGTQGQSTINATIGGLHLEVNTAFPGIVITLASLIGIAVLGMARLRTKQDAAGTSEMSLRGGK